MRVREGRLTLRGLRRRFAPTDSRLGEARLSAIDGFQRFDSAAYARAELGDANATRKGNAALRALAAAKGRPWTRDIVAKCNAPNVRYVEPGTHARFTDDYRGVEAALLPVD